ncbi:hypothetical protein CUMW_193750 [Citrus unshiu]|uniref:URB1 N-terminal domain-containing protein n=1 Tax=Citrus unshiu TaxID=55188 RepID=A0A2H5Q460_CITUN|nr:hypothetical protein CUMW_193750 [Citrus unshiu]
MSFLEEMYSGVLRGLGNDEDEIVGYFLSTLQNRVITEDSLVPPGLRSVLFGRVTLEQLISISGRENGGPTAELAHSVLVSVCTDPCSGLMSYLKRQPNPLRGNPKRLTGLLKNLKATEISYHRDLLFAILQGRPSLASAYMSEFPYNLEDFSSSNWFASVSLAANLLSSVGMGLCFDFLDTQSQDSPSIDNPDVQSILSCICPRPFSRSHGTLRLLLEALKLLDSFISALHHSSCSSSQIVQHWASLIQKIQNEVRTLLPDPQVLLTFLSSQSSQSRERESHLKRNAESAHVLECKSKSRKKLKTTLLNEDTDIIISKMNVDAQITIPKGSENISDTIIVDGVDTEEEIMSAILEIWGLNLCSKPAIALNDADIYFHSKILDTLKFYLIMSGWGVFGIFFISKLSSTTIIVHDRQLLQCSFKNQVKLSSFLTWAISTALKSDSGQMYKLRESHLHLRNMLEDAPFEESLTSKLLRWPFASVILGKLFGKLDIPGSKLSKSSYETLNSLFQDFGNKCVENNKSRFDCKEILAAAIFYLQQLLGLCCGGLPSVISALSLLLLSDVSEYAGSAFKLGHRTSLASLWSRIHCPAEANPCWRWSFYRTWKDLSLELTDLQKIDELRLKLQCRALRPGIVPACKRSRWIQVK